MKKLLIAIGLFASASLTAQIKKLSPFKVGDKVAFVGNSITEAGFYEMYVWQYYMLHFPQRKIQVLNGGIGGDVAGQILDRLDADILQKKPSVVVLIFGMNDSRYFEYFNKPEAEVRKEAVATSFSSYQQIEKKLLALPGIQKIMMASSPYDETMTGPKNNFHGKYATMIEIANFQEAAAKKNIWGFVDLMRPMTAINEREQKLDTNYTLTGTDRIHPGNAGHFVMAYFFLKSQGLTGSVVADVVIDAATGKLQKAVNSSIKNIVTKGGKVSFDYTVSSLPFPTDTVPRCWGNTQRQSDALAVIPFTEEFNKELLTIKGLKSSAPYVLTIDGERIRGWQGGQFAKGINLAVVTNTPQYQQAQKVAGLLLKYRDLEQKLRSYYWLQFNYFKKKGMMYLDTQAAMDSVTTAAAKDWAVNFKKENYQDARKKEVRKGWEKEMAVLIDEMYKLSQPVKHTISVEVELVN